MLFGGHAERTLKIVHKYLADRRIAVGIGDRWDDNQLHFDWGGSH